MTEYRGVIAGTGNAVTGINEISGGLTARYLYNILGYSSGVLKDALSEFNMTYTNLTFSVSGGQAVAYGYIGEITTTSEFTFTAPSANSKYYFVYLDFDLRETIKKFAVSYYDNSNSDVWSPRQDNLANNEAGRFQLPIYKIKIDSDNTITVTDLREIKQIVKEATKINGMELKKDENGVLKIDEIVIPQNKTLWVGSAEQAIIDNSLTINLSEQIVIGEKLKIDGSIKIYKGTLSSPIPTYLNFEFIGIIAPYERLENTSDTTLTLKRLDFTSPKIHFASNDGGGDDIYLDAKVKESNLTQPNILTVSGAIGEKEYSGSNIIPVKITKITKIIE